MRFLRIEVMFAPDAELTFVLVIANGSKPHENLLLTSKHLIVIHTD